MEKNKSKKKGAWLILGLKKDKNEIFKELILPIILFSTLGAFYWAIRGSSGYGGSSGGIFAGIGWAIAWFALSSEKNEKKSRPYNSGWIVLAITLGITVGGMHGYGQFMSWIQGIFRIDSANNIIVPINPITGYLWLFQCGLVWGGITGIMMAWCGSKKPIVLKDWILRIGFGATGGIIAYLITILRPDWIMPLYTEVDYSSCADCIERTISTSIDSMIFLGFFLGFLLYEIFKKDWRNVMLSLTMAIGWGLAFSVFAFWHFGPNFSTLEIDWWKNWEMSIGFFGGTTIGICYYLYNRQFKDTKIEMIRTQPFTLHRNAEKLIGVDLIIIIAIGWSIYNGIDGFTSNFIFNNSLVLIISIPCILILLALFFSSFYKVYKNPFKLNDGKNNIPKPELKALIVNIILVFLGYMVTINREMVFANWFLIWIYTIFLIIGYATFLYLLKKKTNSR